jgi:hypothetical protein
MRAKFINETIGDVLKPKSKEEIRTSLVENPLLNLKREINNACKIFWIKAGLRFNEITVAEEFKKVYNIVAPSEWTHNYNYGVNHKVTKGSSFIPKISTLKNDYYGLKIILYGFIELNNKKFSDKLTKIAEVTFKMDLTDKDFMKTINF